MYVYIRHAQKRFDNGKKTSSSEYNHDPNITDEGRQEAIILGYELVQRYGRPARILVSPYLRCRETAAMLMEAVDHPHQPDGDVPLTIVPDLGEYLGNQYQKGVPIDLDPITATFDPPIDRCFSELQRRVTKHCYRLHQGATDPGEHNDVVWIVTHGLVIQTVRSLLEITTVTQTVECLSVTPIPHDRSLQRQSRKTYAFA